MKHIQQTTSNQPEGRGLAYQILLLSLEAMHFRDTGHGAQHLVNAAFRVVDQAAALTAAREALEFYARMGDDVVYRDQVEFDNGHKAAAALAAIKGEQP